MQSTIIKLSPQYEIDDLIRELELWKHWVERLNLDPLNMDSHIFVQHNFIICSVIDALKHVGYYNTVIIKPYGERVRGRGDSMQSPVSSFGDHPHSYYDTPATSYDFYSFQVKTTDVEWGAND